MMRSFSPRLWTQDGLASLAGDKTFWDRSTLYALRGVLAAGETDKALKILHDYSNRRLLGDHVPYPVEAYLKETNDIFRQKADCIAGFLQKGCLASDPSAYTVLALHLGFPYPGPV
ncbi:MAG: hypothetical protein IPI30_23485 [Saprospiraceae bacterium]|nr:hypothetical protein [Candidatus Vicinibacter affinis]